MAENEEVKTTYSLQLVKDMARILSVSNDELLLKTRQTLLAHEGYEVVSAQATLLN